MEPEALSVGIDIAKAQLDVAVRPTNDRWVVAPDADGLRQVVARLQVLARAIVVLEASGGLELALVTALTPAVVPVVVVNPRQVRDFARATGQLAKTDALAAAILAHFTATVRPPWSSSCAGRSGRVRCGARRTTCCTASPAWGGQLSLTLLAHLPELAPWTAGRSPSWWAWPPSTGTAARCGTNAPSGVVVPGTAPPSTKDALVASHYNPVIWACSRRLLAAGKPKQLALTACSASCRGSSTRCSSKAPLDRPDSAGHHSFRLTFKTG